MKQMACYSTPASALAISLIAAATLTLLPIKASAADEGPFLPKTIVSSTVPENGDVNPYGVAIVPAGFPSGGTIAPGDVLVSNFNNNDNLQGTAYCLTGECSRDSKRCLTKRVPVASRSSGRAAAPFPDF